CHHTRTSISIENYFLSLHYALPILKNKHLIGLLAFICVALAVSGGIAIWIGGDDTQVTATPPLTQELVETVQPDVGASNPSDFLYIDIVILSISHLIAVGISFYLYHWSRILLEHPSSVMTT